MRSRTLKEGSVGLLIIAGVLLFGGIALWLRGVKLGERNYEITAEFPEVDGVQEGDPVRYRGLRVGRVKEIVAGTNDVEIVMEIDSSEILIPREVTIKTNSSGLIGETSVDIEPPETAVTFENPNMTPLANSCDPELILCDGEELSGVSGITLDDFFPLMYELSSRLSANPELFDNVSSAAENAATAADEITQLSQDVAILVADVRSQLNSFADTADTVSVSLEEASGEIGTTVAKYQATADKLNQLADNANGLINQNRDSVITTLNSIEDTSNQLQGLINTLDTTVAQTDTEELVNNLETLTANAAVAAENLQEITGTFADPDSVVTLQQTLDSARVTFANAQKITADLEQVTGDPAFINNFRNLVNGLSNLVSSTDQLEQQIYTESIVRDLQKFSTVNSQEIDRQLSILDLQKPEKTP